MGGIILPPAKPALVHPGLVPGNRYMPLVPRIASNGPSAVGYNPASGCVMFGGLLLVPEATRIDQLGIYNIAGLAGAKAALALCRMDPATAKPRTVVAKTAPFGLDAAGEVWAATTDWPTTVPAGWYMTGLLSDTNGIKYSSVDPASPSPMFYYGRPSSGAIWTNPTQNINGYVIYNSPYTMTTIPSEFVTGVSIQAGADFFPVGGIRIAP